MNKQRIDGINRFKKKVQILEAWIKEEIPYVLTNEGFKKIDKNGRFILEYFPLSITAIRAWNGSKNTDKIVETYSIPRKMTSAETWKALPNSTRENIGGTLTLPSLFERLKQKAQIQRDSGRLSQIRALKEEFKVAQLNHVALAHEMMALRLENDILIEDLRVAERKIEGLKKMYKNEIDWRTKSSEQQKRRADDLEEEKLFLIQQMILIGEKTGIYPELPSSPTNILPFER